MVRADRWKLIYSAGGRHRRDGYALGRTVPDRSIRLYDLANDPDEMTDVASRAENAARVREMIAVLTDHLARTTRGPWPAVESEDVDHFLGRELLPAEYRGGNC